MERVLQESAKILDRFGTIDPVATVGADEEKFAALCVTPPPPYRLRIMVTSW